MNMRRSVLSSKVRKEIYDLIKDYLLIGTHVARSVLTSKRRKEIFDLVMGAYSFQRSKKEFHLFIVCDNDCPYQQREKRNRK